MLNLSFIQPLIKILLRSVLYLRHLKIQSRLVIAFLILSIIPLVTVGLFSYNKYTASINSKLSKFSVQLVEQLDKNILTEIGKCEHLCDQLTMDRIIQEDLSRYGGMDDTARGQVLLDINDLLGSKALLFSYIKNVYVITNQGETFYELGYDSLTKSTIDRLIEGIDNKKPLDHWNYVKTRRNVDSLVLCRRINSVSDSSIQLGYLFIIIDENQFANNTYANVDMGRNSDIFIMDTDGVVISRTNPNIGIGVQYPEPALFDNMLINEKKSIPVFPLKLGGKDYLAVYLYNSRAKWYLTATIPFEYINSETASINTGLLVVCIICFLFSLLFSMAITISMVVPIKKMVGFTNNVSGGNLKVRIHDHYKDEMGYLSGKMNNMVEQIEELVLQNKEEQKMKRELELQMLQAQINPHFLFNTLNSLKWTAMMSRVNTVSDGLGALAELLRNTIVNKNEAIPLKEEIKNIDNYLLIQKIRYGDSFTVSFEIDDEVRENLILKFLLQPIVENCIIHGFYENGRQVDIRIKCFKTEEFMRVSILDNGRGFDPENMNQAEDEADARKGKLTSIGIANVRERVRLNYGEAYGLQINSKIGEGTEVTLNLPLLKE